MIFTTQQRVAHEKGVKAFIASRGGKLEEDWKYVNSSTKIRTTCEKGHKWDTLWSRLKRGNWCPECANQVVHEEDVRQVIVDKHGRLDPDWKYVNKKTKFWVTCNNGHKWKTNWGTLGNHKSWCPYCIGHTVDKDEAKKYIEGRGGSVNRDWKYTNSTDKFLVQCEKGHTWRTCWNVMQSGHWCPDCAKKRIIQNRLNNRTTENHVKKVIESKGGKLDPNWEYSNNYEKFWIECNQGHKWQATWANIKNGSWCPYCCKKRVEEKSILDYIENKGGQVNKDWKFVTSKTKFNVICEKGHKFKACWDKISHNHWCPICFGKNPVEDVVIKEFIKEKNGHLDSDWVYTNSTTKFWITCHKGHRWQAIWSNIRKGHWCPHCNDTVVEKRFRKTMEDIFSVEFPKQKPAWLKNPSTGRLLELDGYNQKLKIAFEYQGPFHYENSVHPESAKGQIKRDEIKLKMCQKNKVYLIIMPYWIPEKNWEKEINTIKSKFLIKG